MGRGHIGGHVSRSVDHLQVSYYLLSVPVRPRGIPQFRLGVDVRTKYDFGVIGSRQYVLPLTSVLVDWVLGLKVRRDYRHASSSDLQTNTHDAGFERASSGMVTYPDSRQWIFPKESEPASKSWHFPSEKVWLLHQYQIQFLLHRNFMQFHGWNWSSLQQCHQENHRGLADCLLPRGIEAVFELLLSSTTRSTCCVSQRELTHMTTAALHYAPNSYEDGTASSMLQVRRKRDIPDKTLQIVPSSYTITTCENPGVTRPEIEPGSYRWEDKSKERPAGIVLGNTSHQRVARCKMGTVLATTLSAGCDDSTVSGPQEKDMKPLVIVICCRASHYCYTLLKSSAIEIPMRCYFACKQLSVKIASQCKHVLRFKRMRMANELKVGAPPGGLVEVPESSYINSTLSVQWMKHFIATFLRHCRQEANSLRIAPKIGAGIRNPEMVADPRGDRVSMDSQAVQLTPEDDKLLSL
ncbi:hypothetical protein PR048_022681 [Dryococelus australis]|uniref:Uncharacterized protein n=1 Tax=Dryococelus australis TaxID=614101 RepID=A0ABQ9GS03_9NEOP|nr:hypothetical protein PR048_022681 [Dryococelus australis]